MAHVPAAVRRAQIIEAAADVIAQAGVAGVTTRRVAGEAKVSLATLHYVFPAKDDILAGVLEMLLDRARHTFDQMLQEVAEPDDDHHRTGLASVVNRLARAYWAVMRRDLAAQRMQYELTLYALRTPEAAHLGRALYDYYLDTAEKLVRTVCERDGQTLHCPRRDLAHLIVSGIDGIIIQDLIRDDPDQVQRSLDNLSRAIVALATTPAPGDDHGDQRADGS